MRPIDADVVLKRIKNAIAFYSSPTQGDFDTGRKIGLISAEEIVAEEATNAEYLLAEWEECDYKKVEHGFVVTHTNQGICCSACRQGFKKSELKIRNFCPNCGKPMRKGEEYETD